MNTSLRTLVGMVVATAMCAAGCSDPDTNVAAEADTPDEPAVDTSNGSDSQHNAGPPPLAFARAGSWSTPNRGCRLYPAGRLVGCD